MTIEESKVMWNLEKENINFKLLTKEMKALYDKVDELINDGTITYEDFTNDMIDALTNNIISNGQANAEPNRAEQINAICESLLNKYEEYHRIEPTEGDTGILADNTELSDELELCESECTDGTC